MATSTKQVYNYVLKTPENINGNVLKSFLNDVSGNLDDFIAGKISEITCNLENIPDFAFAGKSELETVNLPNAIYIGKYAFSSAPTSQSGSGSESSSGEGSESGEGEEDLVFNNKKLKTVNMDKVTHIERDAFTGDENLEITELPDSLLVIEDRAFRDCPKVQLTEFPKNVVYIGDQAFDNQENIDLSTIPNSLIYLGRDVITNDKLNEYLQQFVEDSILITSSVVPHGLFELDSINKSSIFSSFSIDGIYIPEDISTIGRRLYQKKCSNIKEINIPNNIIIIGDSAFSGCNALTSLTIPNSVTSIGDGAFYNCNALTSLTIPNSVTSIGDYAFSVCSALTSLTIPNSVTSIGDSAFYNCNALTSLTIPNSVTSIKGDAFYGCNALTTLDLTSYATNDQIPQIESNTFANYSSNLQIKFSSQEVLNNFASATNWSTLSDYFVVASE